jgi:hypothetical protein
MRCASDINSNLFAYGSSNQVYTCLIPLSDTDLFALGQMLYASLSYDMHFPPVDLASLDHVLYQIKPTLTCLKCCFLAYVNCSC